MIEKAFKQKPQAIFLLIAVILLSGCSKFLKSESENLTPFASHTISMVSSLEYGLTDDELLYLRRIDDYIDDDAPFVRFQALENQVSSQLKALVVYSIQMVTISELPISENEKSNALADILVSLSELVNKDQVVSREKSDIELGKNIIAEVRVSENYLDSLRILLPSINAFSAHALNVVDELELEKRTIVSLLEHAIDNKYGSAIAFDHTLHLVRNAYYDALIAMAYYGDTQDAKYLDQVRAARIPVVNGILKDKKSLTTAEMRNLHKLMTERMANLNENYSQMKADIDAYHDSHRELKKMVETKEAGIKEARLTFIVWGRAYQKMALGKTEPAEWFDVTESGSLLMGTAGRAVGL